MTKDEALPVQPTIKQGWDVDTLLDKPPLPVQPEQEPLAYAGVKMWVGNQQVVRLLTQTELHYAVEPWLLVELSALKCIAALKEKTA